MRVRPEADQAAIEAHVLHVEPEHFALATTREQKRANDRVQPWRGVRSITRLNDCGGFQQ
jgi:hypothetical protein